MSTVVIIGGSAGIGRALAERFAGQGHDVVVTSRDAGRAKEVASEIGLGAVGIEVDLGAPETVAGSLRDLPAVDHLVITAADAVLNTFAEFDLAAAAAASTVKLVGYPAAVHALKDRFTPSASVVLFGGLSMDRPFPGSAMVTSTNGAVSALVRSLALELAPTRVNALHPGVVGDSPRWRDVPDHPLLPRTPIGRFVTMAEVADAVEFLLRNGGMNAVDLHVNGGLHVS
jgi:NAD(P)-dependent dehydrogenase (short-subunit alcohol dehydrogenase family)